MKMNCVKMKQIKRGLYKFYADGDVEVRGYHYAVGAGTIVMPDNESVVITGKGGSQYTWHYISHRSEWALDADVKSIILKNFDGENADVITIKKTENPSRKALMTVRCNNVLYDLPKIMTRLFDAS